MSINMTATNGVIGCWNVTELVEMSASFLQSKMRISVEPFTLRLLRGDANETALSHFFAALC